MLTDSDRIRNLLGTYCELVDSGDFEGLGRLFARGALASDAGFQFAAGEEAVAAWYRGGTLLHDGSPRTKHLVGDIVFEEPHRSGSVTVRSSYVVHQAAPGGPLQPIIAGRYVDRFQRHAVDGWHFVERRFIVDLVGDISRHWSGPT